DIPTNPCNYLIPFSNHPTHIFDNIPISLFIRIRRICSSYIDYLRYNFNKILGIFRSIGLKYFHNFDINSSFLQKLIYDSFLNLNLTFVINVLMKVVKLIRITLVFQFKIIQIVQCILLYVKNVVYIILERQKKNKVLSDFNKYSEIGIHFSLKDHSLNDFLYFIFNSNLNEVTLKIVKHQGQQIFGHLDPEEALIKAKRMFETRKKK
ncbi:hypothetical protein BpHYR1_024291, partial [Brachionus plicatilis]